MYFNRHAVIGGMYNNRHTVITDTATAKNPTSSNRTAAAEGGWSQNFVLLLAHAARVCITAVMPSPCPPLFYRISLCNIGGFTVSKHSKRITFCALVGETPNPKT